METMWKVEDGQPKRRRTIYAAYRGIHWAWFVNSPFTKQIW